MATNPYTNKVIFGNSTVMDITDTTADENDVASGKVFYKASGERSVGTGSASGEYVTEPELRDTVGWTGKNRFELIRTSNTGTYFTVTSNNNESLTVVGSRSGQDTWLNYLDSETFTGISGTYIWSGCPDTGSYDTYYSYIIDKSDSNRVYPDLGSGVEITLNSSHVYQPGIFVKDGYSINKTFRPMLRYADILDTTYEPYHKSVDYVKANRDEVKDVVGWSGKNLLNTDWLRPTRIKNDVTITNNGNGTFTINGTCSGDSNSDLTWSNVPLLNGEYFYTVEGAVDGIAVQGFDASGTPIATIASTKGSKRPYTRFTATSDYAYYTFQIVIVNGNSYSNILLKPMLRRADIVDDTYEPYHDSVKQTLREYEVIEGKNLLDVASVVNTQTLNDVTYTVNSDGSVNVNGTALANTFFNVPFVLPVGSFTLTGCPSGGSYQSYIAKITNREGTAITGIGDDSGSGSTFVNSTEQEAFYCIRVASGYVASNVLFRPMLRLASETDDTFEPYYAPLKDRVSTLESYTDTIVRASNGSIQEFVSTKVWTLEVATFTNVTRNLYYQLYCLPPSGSSHYGDSVSAIIDHVESVANPNSSTGYDLKYYVACDAIGIRFRLIQYNNKK